MLIFFLIVAITAHSQPGESKGVIIKPAPENKPTGTSRALVVGVSEYQQIRSLQYADKDAEEFSNFLLTNPNWKLAPENVVLLTNEKATSGNIVNKTFLGSYPDAKAMVITRNNFIDFLS